MIIRHPEIGFIQLNTRSNARRQTIRITPNKVTITVPPGCERYVLPLSDRTIQQIQEARKRLTKSTPDPLIFTLDSTIHTLSFDAVVRRHERNDIHVFGARLENRLLTINIPAEADIASPQVQSVLRKLLHRFLLQEAERTLPAMLATVARHCNMTYKSVKIDSARSRWGCCSSHRDIKLSCFLLLLPEQIIEYVLVHELCHTVEMNHGPKFKALLRSFFANADTLEREKKQWDRKVLSIVER